MRTLLAAILAIAMFLWFVPWLMQRLAEHHRAHHPQTFEVEPLDGGVGRGVPPRGARPAQDRTVDL